MNKSVCHKISRLSQNRRYLVDKRMKEFGLCRTEWRMLVNYDCLEQPATQKALLKALDIDAAHLARTLKKLEKEGYIIRKPVSENKRSLNIYLTKEGEELLKQIQKVMAWENELLFSGFTENERDVFAASLDKMEKNIAGFLSYG